MNGRDHFDEDGYDPHENGRRYSNPTSAGMIGFIAAMLSLGFLAVVLVLYLLLKQDERLRENVERERLMFYWFLVLDILSFFTALTATVLCGRGLSPTNPLYRGWAVTGLILAILEMIATIGFGLIMTCAVLIVELRR